MQYSPTYNNTSTLCQSFKTYINHYRIVHTGDYMFGLGTQEIILILILLLILFGANKLPELARSLGVSVREFKKAVKEIEEEPKD